LYKLSSTVEQNQVKRKCSSGVLYVWNNHEHETYPRQHSI